MMEVGGKLRRRIMPIIWSPVEGQFYADLSVK